MTNHTTTVLKQISKAVVLAAAAFAVSTAAAKPASTASASDVPDYRRTLNRVIQLTERNLYDPAQLSHPAWTELKRATEGPLPEFGSRKEFAGWFWQHARELPFSHYGVTVAKKPAADTKSSASKPEAERLYELNRLEGDIGYLRVRSFSGKRAGMEDVIRKLRNMAVDKLIIDLRGNPGGSVEAALPLANYLWDGPQDGGVFVTRRWFDQHEHPPTAAEYAEFPAFTAASFRLIMEGIHTRAGLRLRLKGDPNPFKGRLMVLTDGRTGSTCEPLAYGIQHGGRGTLVGERTAGQMLNGEAFDLGQGLKLFMPTADYYTVDGKRLDGVGVMPDIQVPSDQALDVALAALRIEQ